MKYALQENSANSFIQEFHLVLPCGATDWFYTMWLVNNEGAEIFYPTNKDPRSAFSPASTTSTNPWKYITFIHVNKSVLLTSFLQELHCVFWLDHVQLSQLFPSTPQPTTTEADTGLPPKPAVATLKVLFCDETSFNPWSMNIVYQKRHHLQIETHP